VKSGTLPDTVRSIDSLREDIRDLMEDKKRAIEMHITFEE
jgi:hypothetical protein